MRSEATAEDEELADESVKDRQADEREGGDDVKGGHVGQASGQASESADLVGAITLVQEAGQDKKGAAGESFVEDLVDGAVKSGERETEDAKDAEAERAQH